MIHLSKLVNRGTISGSPSERHRIKTLYSIMKTIIKPHRLQAHNVFDNS